MKKKLLSAVLATTVTTLSAYANEASFSVAIDGYDLLTDVYGIQFEWFKSDNFSLLAKPYLLNRSESGIDWNGYGIELAGRMYKGGLDYLGDENNPYGTYLQFGLDLGYVKAEIGNYSDDSFFLGFNTKAGYRYVISNGVFIDLGLGIGYYTSNVVYRDSDYRDLDGVELFGTLSLGYQF